MNKKLKDSLFIANNILCFIGLAVFFTLLVAPLIHQNDVQKYGLEAFSGLTALQIKDEMTRLVGYLWLWHRAPLELMYFPMSKTGVIHFAEVKVFVDLVQIIGIVTTIIFVIGTYRRLKKKDILFLKTTAVTTYVVLGTLLLFGMVSFDRLFVLFHEIVFRNDYWLFSYTTDPVIKILPQEFFMHGFFAIVAFVVLFATLCLGLYHYYIQPKK